MVRAMSNVDGSFWRDRPVFVTGATGLLGSWLTKALHDAHAEVVVLVRDWVPGSELCRSGVLEQLRVVRGELCDQALVERILGEYEVNTVLHVGAQALVPVANRNPVSTFESNIRGTWTLLEACRRSPTVKQIVVASSDKAYGEQEDLPYREDAPLKGRYPYDASKACADLLAQSYWATFQLPVVVARCGNLYGGGDLNWNRIIPGTIRSLIRRERPVVRSDGSLVRDYFYVEDGASAYMTLAQRLAEERALAGEAFNFSNEQPISVLELVRAMLTLMEAEGVEPLILNQAPHEIPRQYLSALKARERLGWRARFSLEQGLSRTIRWYRDFFHAPAQRTEAQVQA